MGKRIFAGVVLSLAGCGGEPRIDASSQASAKASMMKILAGLPEAERREFASDCAALALADITAAGYGALGKGQPPADMNTMRSLDGLTRSEIRARAEVKRAEVKARFEAKK